MLDERDEFLLSRYPDGDLTGEERAKVESLLAESEEAREALRTYRQLSGLLKLGREQPELDHDALRRSIWDGVDRVSAGVEEGTPEGVESGRPAGKLRIRAWGRQDERVMGLRIRRIRRGVALAACAVLAVGLGWQVYRTAGTGVGGVGDGLSAGGMAGARPPGLTITIGHSGFPVTEMRTAGGSAVIEGPKPEARSGPALADVNIVAPAKETPASIFYKEERSQRQPRIAITPEGAKEDGRNPF